MTSSTMAVTHTVSAWIRVMSDSPMVDPLGPLPAGVGTGPGGGGAGDQGHGQQDQVDPGQPEYPAG